MNVTIIKSTSISELKSEIFNSIHFTPTLVILFASEQFDYDEIVNIFPKTSPITLWGASAYKGIYNAQYAGDCITAIVTDLPQEAYTVYFEETKNCNTRDIAKRAVLHAQNKFENFALLALTSSLHTDGDAVVEGVNSQSEKPVLLFGGMASDTSGKETTVFINGKYSTDGASFLAINTDMVDVVGTLTSGWKTIDIERTVTHAVGNRLYKLDGEPALDIFSRYYTLPEEKSELGITIGSRYPLEVTAKGKAPVLRTSLIAHPEDGSLTFAGSVPVGATVKFTMQPSYDIIESTVNTLGALKEKMPQPELMILFSCMARDIAFGPLMSEEIEGINRLWDAPMGGFFTYGEYGNADGESSNFHNETCCLVLFREIGNA